jgi:hypothetical protein
LRPVGIHSARHFAEHFSSPGFGQVSAATCAVTLWPSVDTRAQP